MSHRPAFSSYEKGTWGFRLRASSFCSGAKGTKRPPGAAHGHLQCPIPPRPGPPFILRWSHQGAVHFHPARAKDRIPFLAPPAAALCWLNGIVFLQEESRLMLCPRGGLRCGSARRQCRAYLSSGVPWRGRAALGAAPTLRSNRPKLFRENRRLCRRGRSRIGSYGNTRNVVQIQAGAQCAPLQRNRNLCGGRMRPTPPIRGR